MSEFLKINYMTNLEKLQKRQEFGQNIMNNLFKLTDDELKTVLLSLIPAPYNRILEYNCDCIRVIRNSKPEKLEFWFHEGIIINTKEVIFSKHGIEKSVIQLTEFNIYQ